MQIKKELSMKNQQGFTLVELLITSVLLAILASISIGVLYTYQDKSRYAELETVARNFEASSFLLMQSLDEDIPISSCSWAYDKVSGENSIHCDSPESDNIFADLFEFNSVPIVIMTNFINDNSTYNWNHITTVFHCNIRGLNNQITYFNNSVGAVVRAASRVDPAPYAARCSS